MTFRDAKEEERYCAQTLSNIAISLSSLRLPMGLLVLLAIPNALSIVSVLATKVKQAVVRDTK